MYHTDIFALYPAKYGKGELIFNKQLSKALPLLLWLLWERNYGLMPIGWTSGKKQLWRRVPCALSVRQAGQRQSDSKWMYDGSYFDHDKYPSNARDTLHYGSFRVPSRSMRRRLGAPSSVVRGRCSWIPPRIDMVACSPIWSPWKSRFYPILRKLSAHPHQNRIRAPRDMIRIKSMPYGICLRKEARLEIFH